ncbi:MAG: hypothetical protein CVV44_08730 [Spirochaetae bacterium HGW-Spirochaetae-1]|jgi:glycosyltransferase involved in cell wall biosynthesis|nr:MAG: hypothetical protein CVV44_08730 [Spirochaetae bacterium HGW-Spirochaetae-1]
MKKTDSHSLKIVMVTDVFDGAWGGGMVSTERFVRVLREQGYDVTVLSTGAPAAGKAVVPGYYFPIPAVKRIMKKNGFIFAIPKRDILKKIFEEADIIHVQFPFLLGYGTVRLARKLGKPVISSFHVQPENILYNIGIRNDALTGMLYRFFNRILYNRSAAVICPSRFARSELQKHGLQVPGFVVSNGILPRFRPVDAVRKKDYDKYFIIYTVGRLARDKRHDIIIDAIKQSRYGGRIKLIIAGRGPLEDEIKTRAADLPVPADIGYVDDDELLENYNMADLYVHASEVELESMTVLEAMACGLPALISDSRTSAAKQFALDERFLFRSDDPRDLAAKIDNLVENRYELEKAGRQYREKAGQYSIERSCHRLISIYSMVLEGRQEELLRVDVEVDAMILH